jgi:alkylation response protein AidB-like acyl-CoA dehydrogenase
LDSIVDKKCVPWKHEGDLPVTVGLSAVGALPGELSELRLRVREFLQAEVARGAFRPAADAWMSGVDVGFSQRLAERGWVGMTIPAQYGGPGRSALERYVVTEELLAAGAPVGAHWIADRQMAPSILRNGTEEQKRTYLPKIARAQALFSIGMSEPDSGSDLASVRTRARLTEEGWRLSGTKLWTSIAHIATAMIILARTDDPVGADGQPSRHAGLSQFIVDLPNPGIRISPVVTIDGAHHFNEVLFDDALIPASALLGRRGDGWRQVTAELGNERSGPERILSTMPVLTAWASSRPRGEAARADLGRLAARAAVLRQLSAAVADELDRGGNPATPAALVKDLGTRFESEVAEVVSAHVGAGPEPLQALAGQATLHVPVFTLRGGTTEVLRGIVAKDLILTSRTAAPRRPARDERTEIAEAVRGVLRTAPGSWKDVARLGFTALTVPEELGGSGGDLRDAAVVAAEAARWHVPLPVAEANFLAGPLLAAAGIELPDGVLTGAAGTVTADRAGRLTGTVRDVPWLRDADYLVMLAVTPEGEAVALVPVTAPGLSVTPGVNLAGEHRDTAVLDGVAPAHLARLRAPAADRGTQHRDWAATAELLGAAARAVQIGGAAQAVLDQSVKHAGERVQFGRTLDRFQAVQQLLARLAADATTVSVAADAAVLALAAQAPEAELLVAAAKAEASALALEIARAGHQVHGAIGYTAEHPLGEHTKRLWSWRQESGNELYWRYRIAGLIDKASGQLWPLLTNTADEHR